MSTADIISEYRMIRAIEYELKEGKPWTEDQEQVSYDPEFDEWLKRT